MDLAAVNAQVRRILTAPNVDLATISSKKVRKELAETFGASAVKENKEAIDALIIEQFNQIATAAGATQAPSSQQAGAVKTEEGTSNGDAHHATKPAHQSQSNGHGQSSAAASAGSSAVASTSASASASASKQQQRERDRVKQQQAESDASEEEDASGSDSDAPPPKPKSQAQPGSSVKSSPQKQRLQEYTGLPMESSPSIPLSLNAGLTDEEYARKLQAELNAGAFGAGTRATRGGGFQSNAKKGKRKQSSSSKSEGKSKGGKKYRSKAYIEDSDLEGEDGHHGRSNDDDDDSESEGSDTPKPKKKRKAGTGNTGGGYNKELALSESLQKVCRQPTMSRPQIVKRLWEYIRENNLQDPKKKSDIINDDLFKEIFGVEKMTMFSMNKYLTKNVSPIEG